jgi:hypothetical protein
MRLIFADERSENLIMTRRVCGVWCRSTHIEIWVDITTDSPYKKWTCQHAIELPLHTVIKVLAYQTKNPARVRLTI